MRNLLVWQEHEPFLTGYEPHSFVRCQRLKYIETLPARRHKLDGNAQPFVFAYELQGCFSELPVKERLIEQWTDRNTLFARCTPPCTPEPPKSANTRGVQAPYGPSWPA